MECDVRLDDVSFRIMDRRLCLDAQGLTNGNDGPFKDEAKYTGIAELGPTDADILWIYDMRAELNTYYCSQ